MATRSWAARISSTIEIVETSAEILQHRNEIVADRRNDNTCGLRDDDVLQEGGARETDRAAGFPLALVNREDASPVDFRQIGAVVHRQSDDAGGEGLEPDAILRQAIIDDEQLDEQRRAPDDLDIGATEEPQRPAARQPHEGERQPGDQRQRHGHHRQLDGGHRAPQKIGEYLGQEVHSASSHRRKLSLRRKERHAVIAQYRRNLAR